RESFAMRVLAEHARSATMLVSDGVFPSNEGRGYVLRRIIRRAVRYAYLLGTEKLVMPTLSETAIAVMGNAYPDVVKNRDFVVGVLAREEERFRQTLKTGLGILEDELSDGHTELPGSTAFLLHDTYGFPLELTEEIAGERGVRVDGPGFDAEMQAQRERAKAARKGKAADDDRLDAYREVVEQFGTTEFLGYTQSEAEGRVLAVLDGDDGTVEIFLDRTPFYAEAGGQVGDTGTITTPGGTADVLDTTYALPGLRRHTAKVTSGTITAGEPATAAIDVARRDAIRRNHTGTHILHYALRKVLGEHVKQAGSLVGPDRLRFDFSHYAAVTDDEIRQIEEIANAEVLANATARVFETTKAEAEALGAIAFFGDKYGDLVRVLEVGNSIELCGGTHVRAAGDIGLIKVVSEASIGSNLRRIEATTGANTLALLQRDAAAVSQAARLVGATADDLVGGVQRRMDEIKALHDELKQLRAKVASGRAAELAAAGSDGVVVAQVDGLSPNELRDLAIAVRQQAGVLKVVLGGVTDTGGVSLVAAVQAASGAQAGDLIRDAAKAVGGGGGGKGDIATAGGKNPDGLPEALRIAEAAARG
ncbi:MAG: alanine--tRNA ligase, partial [Ilumatobacter sp.]|nr:alanine--tRNA ligase [Ilumatobacter sp.]